MRLLIREHHNLAQLLGHLGHELDLRCGGLGTCGRCTVRLLSGEWEVNGKCVTAPAEALSCRTRLRSDSGEIEFTPMASNGKISVGWRSRPLPRCDETVIAVDIGTTTIAAVKIRNGEILKQASCFNAQSKYGDNVITRISRAATELDGLQQAVHNSIRDVLTELDAGDVTRIAIAGNTVMTLLFHGIDPAPVGVMPFTPPARCFPERSDLFGGIPVLTVPCIAGYVGGDLTAGLHETGLAEKEMLVDIGTNCEIIFHSPTGLICTAAAAGPAFEGAGLHFGSRAVPGAIDHYYGPGDFSVLGEIAPQGICGSGYVDFLAVERRTGRINEIGRYTSAENPVPIGNGVAVHEYDVEQLLKAKAAVWAGIKTLEDHCGVKAEKIYLAGGFAQYLDLDNAISIGMLPERDYEIAGNVSLGGAARLAVSPEIMPELEASIDRLREIPLNLLPEFEDNFIDGLFLP